MKILVTGGAGFIGSNFARMALSGKLPGLEEAHITVFDALTYSGTLTNLEAVQDYPATRLSAVTSAIARRSVRPWPVMTPSSTLLRKAMLIDP